MAEAVLYFRASGRTLRDVPAGFTELSVIGLFPSALWS